jgi:hypothetical protein
LELRLLKALYFGGVRAEANTEIDLPDHLAGESIGRGVAERVNPAPAPVGPMTTESVPDIVPGKPRKFARKE